MSECKNNDLDQLFVCINCLGCSPRWPGGGLGGKSFCQVMIVFERSNLVFSWWSKICEVFAFSSMPVYSNFYVQYDKQITNQHQFLRDYLKHICYQCQIYMKKIFDIFLNKLHNILQYHVHICICIFNKIQYYQININDMIFVCLQIQYSFMLSSIRYRSKSSNFSFSSTFVPNKRFILEIMTVKAILLIVLFIFPPYISQETLCICITLLASLDFWISKNLGRKYVGACWYIDTSNAKDQWVFEAGLKSPGETNQSIFWYSFIFYGLFLIVMCLLTLIDNKHSLFCAIVIAFLGNYVNFYAFSKIIEMRNQGVLQLISDQVQGTGVGEVIKLPLSYVSKLQPIQQQNSIEFKQ